VIIVRPIIVTDACLTTSNVATPETGTVAYNAATTYGLNDRVTFETGTIAVTISNASPAVCTTATAHELEVGTLVSFTTTGALPTGLTVGYQYVITSKTAYTFTLSFLSPIYKIPVITSSAGAGTHTCVIHYHKTYVSLQASNTAHSPRLAASATWWQEEGATNRYKMFDGSVSSQSVGSTISIKITSNQGLMDTLALLNISGTSCVVKIYDTDAVAYIYNQTHSLIVAGITPQETVSDLLLVDLPTPSTGAYWLEVVLSDAGPFNTCAIGALICGLEVDAGTTQSGIDTGIQDYSIIEANEFGNYGITERAYSRTASWTSKVPLTSKARIYRILSEQKAKRTLYVGNTTDTTTAIYGFPDDWNFTSHDDDTSALLNISLKGFT
jgi:hypothetical protein